MTLSISARRSLSSRIRWNGLDADINIPVGSILVFTKSTITRNSRTLFLNQRRELVAMGTRITARQLLDHGAGTERKCVRGFCLDENTREFKLVKDKMTIRNAVKSIP